MHAGDGRLERRTSELAADLRDRQRAGRERAPDAGHAAQVGDGGRDDVDAAVGVVDPVDRHLVDAQAGPLGQHEQLGVEEPAGVLDERQEPAGAVGADRLEAALRVGEARPQRRAQQQVVAARDELALGAAHDPRGARASRVPIATSLWPEMSGATSGSRAFRSVERSTSMYATTVGVAGLPDGAQRPAAALLLEVDGLHAGQAGGQVLRDGPRRVGAGVVRDGDAGGQREGGLEVDVEPFHAGGESGLLVEHGDDDLDGARVVVRLHGKAAAGLPGSCVGGLHGPISAGQVETSVSAVRRGV